MKSIYFSIAAIAMAALSLVSCKTDDDTTLTGENSVTLEFDNGVNGDDLLLGVSSYTNSNGETLTINRLNYIVSNFVLIDENGNKYTYPKNDSYFIVSEENGLNNIVLQNIPAGNYVKLRFGVGVDQEKYLEGASGAGDFLEEAEAYDMMWSWQAGYKFLSFEGTFTSPTVTSTSNFTIHMGSHGSALDNYREVTVSLPATAIVSSNMSPILHFKVDANKILDGDNKIVLSEAATIMIDEVKSSQIADNVSTMFMVHHVHNGEDEDND